MCMYMQQSHNDHMITCAMPVSLRTGSPSLPGIPTPGSPGVPFIPSLPGGPCS